MKLAAFQSHQPLGSFEASTSIIFLETHSDNLSIRGRSSSSDFFCQLTDTLLIVSVTSFLFAHTPTQPHSFASVTFSPLFLN